MYMIDLKGGVELKRYEKVDNVEFKIQYLKG